MSTILKSLKKLEEEKSVLDQNIDLTNLVIHDTAIDNAGHFRSKSRYIAIGLFLLLGGAILGGVIGLAFKKSEPPRPANPAPIQQPVAELPTAAFTNTPGLHTGIALESIDDSSFAKSESIFSDEEPTPLPVQPKNPPRQSVTSTDQKDKDIEAIIQTAKSAVASKASGLEGTATRGYIPGLKLKGIIYFDENSPSNYIFYSTAQDKNRKLKIGESAAGAVLEKIYPNKAEFSYLGKRVDVAMGE
jgi:hypothetical protein